MSSSDDSRFQIDPEYDFSDSSSELEDEDVRSCHFDFEKQDKHQGPQLLSEALAEQRQANDAVCYQIRQLCGPIISEEENQREEEEIVKANKRSRQRRLKRR